MSLQLLIEIAGGIALLLWGIRMVRTGINRSFGAELRRVLSASGKNWLASFATGFGVTTLLQSSTATALIIAPYAARGVIAGAAALAIMLGADVGTAAVVQFLSIGAAWLAPIFILAGVVVFHSSGISRPRGLARAAIGLGLVLLSLQMISAASQPLRSSEILALVLQSVDVTVALLFAAVLTWLSASSVAMVLLIMALAAAHVVDLPLAMALVLGANLGGAFVAVALTWRGIDTGREVPIGNVTMRTIGALVCLPLIPIFQRYLTEFSSDPARVVVNFHFAFNLALAIVFLPLVGVVDRIVRTIVPRHTPAEQTERPRYLDENAVETPKVAINCAMREALHMGDIVQGMLRNALDVFRKNDERLMHEIERADDYVDRLHEAIKLYIAKLQKEELDAAESSRAIDVMSFTTNLEHIGDIIDKNLMELAAKKIKARSTFSRTGLSELEAFHARILSNFELAMNVFMSGDLALARRLLRDKSEIRQLERAYVESHFSRIGEGRPESIETSALHIDVLRDLKRIHSHLTSVAYPILEAAGELAESRLLSLDEEAEDRRLRRQPVRPPAPSARTRNAKAKG